jgi:hypothetical protein
VTSDGTRLIVLLILSVAVCISAALLLNFLLGTANFNGRDSLPGSLYL